MQCPVEPVDGPPSAIEIDTDNVVAADECGEEDLVEEDPDEDGGVEVEGAEGGDEDPEDVGVEDVLLGAEDAAEVTGEEAVAGVGDVGEEDAAANAEDVGEGDA